MPLRHPVHLTLILSVLALAVLPSTGCKTKKKGKTIATKTSDSRDPAKDSTKTGPSGTKKDPAPDGTSPKVGSAPTTAEKTAPTSPADGKKDGKTPAAAPKSPATPSAPAKTLTAAERLKAQTDEKYALAKAYLARRGEGEQKNAILAARDVLKLNYEHFGAMLVIAEAQYNLGSYGKMFAALERIKLLRAKMSPPTKLTARWHILMGRFYLHLTRDFEKKGFVLKALFQKQKATKEFSHPSTDTSAEALFVRGSLQLESGDYAKALLALKKAEALNDPSMKNNWRLYLNLGVTYIYNKSYLLAEKKLSYCLRALNANCMNCHFNLALIYSLWDEVPTFGSYTAAQRATLVMRHAGQYRAWLRSQRTYDKSLLSKVNRWIEIANTKK